jgi:hypothetical protein
VCRRTEEAHHTLSQFHLLLFGEAEWVPKVPAVSSGTSVAISPAVPFTDI